MNSTLWAAAAFTFLTILGRLTKAEDNIKALDAYLAAVCTALEELRK